MKFPRKCKTCGYKVTYLTIVDGKKVCIKCKSELPGIDEKVVSSTVITNKGGKRICRSN